MFVREVEESLEPPGDLVFLELWYVERTISKYQYQLRASKHCTTVIVVVILSSLNDQNSSQIFRL